MYVDLNNETYKPSESVFFVNLKPKPREIWAAEFKDRIVHHFVYEKLSPSWEKTFLKGSFACREGKGTLAAVNFIRNKIVRYHKKTGKHLQYVKFDLCNFFVSIDKEVLKDKLLDNVPIYSRTYDLACTVIDYDPTENYRYNGDKRLMSQVPEHKRLISSPKGFGLPIGNLTSQFFANVLLNYLDHYIMDNIPNYGYARYVDDFIILIDRQYKAKEIEEKITNFLKTLNLKINPSKTKVNNTKCGVDFLGYVIYPTHVIPRKRVAHAIFEKINEYLTRTDCTEEDYKKFVQSINSMIGALTKCNAYNIRVKVKKKLKAHGFTTDVKASRILSIFDSVRNPHFEFVDMTPRKPKRSNSNFATKIDSALTHTKFYDTY